MEAEKIWLWSGRWLTFTKCFYSGGAGTMLGNGGGEDRRLWTSFLGNACDKLGRPMGEGGHDEQLFIQVRR